MSTKAMADKVQADKQQDQDDDDDPKHLDPARCAGGRAPRRRCHRRPTWAVYTFPIGSCPAACRPPRRGHEQHQQGSAGVDYKLDSQSAEISIGQNRRRRLVCQAASWLHVQEQDDGGKDAYQEFRQDPILSEQAPLGTQ